jgi:hypothetical protein
MTFPSYLQNIFALHLLLLLERSNANERAFLGWRDKFLFNHLYSKLSSASVQEKKERTGILSVSSPLGIPVLLIIPERSDPQVHQLVGNSVWTLSRRQGKWCFFVGRHELAVARISYHLSAELDKFYGFCNIRVYLGKRSIALLPRSLITETIIIRMGVSLVMSL